MSHRETISTGQMSHRETNSIGHKGKRREVEVVDEREERKKK